MHDRAGPAAVLFDMDGTLLDSREALIGAYQAATTEVLGAPFPVEPTDADHIIQLRARDAFPEIAGGDLDLARRIEAAFAEGYRERATDVQLYDGVAGMLAGLRDQGVALGLATSKSRSRLALDLQRTGIGKLFESTICGDEVPAAKPDPAPILATMKVMGVNPGTVLYVGDGANDIEAAHAAGTRAVGAGYGFHPAACRAAGPDHWIEQPLELLELVGALRHADAS